MAAVCSRVWAQSCITLRMEPTLYSPMILSSLAGSMASWVSSSMVMMVSWTSWPAFSFRVISFRTCSTFASTSALCAMAGSTEGLELQAAIAALSTAKTDRYINDFIRIMELRN